MKAKFIAGVMSLFMVTLSTHAIISKKTLANNQVPIVVHKIDLNKADIKTLKGSIKGIGTKRAEAIIAYRKSHQGFKSLEELAEVKGFGQHFVTANRDKLNEVFVIGKVE